MVFCSMSFIYSPYPQFPCFTSHLLISPWLKCFNIFLIQGLLKILKGCLFIVNLAPLSLRGVGLILSTHYVPIVFLNNWALVTSTLVSRFLFNQHPFLFKALAHINNGDLVFKDNYWQFMTFSLPWFEHSSPSSNALVNHFDTYKIPFWNVCINSPFPF